MKKFYFTEAETNPSLLKISRKTYPECADVALFCVSCNVFTLALFHVFLYFARFDRAKPLQVPYLLEFIGFGFSGVAL